MTIQLLKETLRKQPRHVAAAVTFRIYLAALDYFEHKADAEGLPTLRALLALGLCARPERHLRADEISHILSFTMHRGELQIGTPPRSFNAPAMPLAQFMLRHGAFSAGPIRVFNEIDTQLPRAAEIKTTPNSRVSSNGLHRLFVDLISSDCARIAAGEDLTHAPFATDKPSILFILHHTIAPYRLGANATDFWSRWYRGFVDGRPLDWDLQRRVALLPDEDWDAGPEHLARKIAQIEAELLAEKLPLAETVEINPETGRFRAVPIAVQNAPLLGAALGRVQDALDDALQGNNGLNERSREARVIDRLARRHGNDPQRIEMDLTALATGLRRQFEVQDLPRSEDNLALLDATEETVRAIRATHPEVAENRAILATQAARDLTAPERDTLAAALPVLQEISEAPLSEDFAEDLAEVLAPRLPGVRRDDPGGGAPALPGEVRLFSRVAKMARLAEGIRRIDNSAAYKGARIVTTAASASALLYTLVQIGLRLFGVL